MAMNTANPSTVDASGHVFIPFLPEDEREIARALLGAAGDHRVDEIFSQSGGFLVPLDIATAAGYAPGESAAAVAAESPVTAPEAPAPVEAPAEPAPAKKAAAKAADVPADAAPAAS